MSSDFNFAKYGKRELSDFLVKQMLFDYIEDELDEERKKTLEEYLSLHPEMKIQLSYLEKGVAFCDQLAQIQLPDQFNISLGKKTERDFNLELPSFMRWGIEAFSVSAIAILLVFMPWNKIKIFWQDSFYNSKAQIIKLNVQQRGTDSLEGEPPQVVRSKADSTEKNIKTLSLESNKDRIKKSKRPKRMLASLATQVSSKSVYKKNKESTGEGALYRLFMSSNEIDSISDLIAGKIVALGGEKAGDVRLGWKKNGGRYFHFTLPEGHKSKLVKFLEKFSSVKVRKYPHKRIMKDGTLRLVLWVENK